MPEVDGDYMKQCVVVLHKGSKVILLGKDHRLAQGALNSLMSDKNVCYYYGSVVSDWLTKTVHLIGDRNLTILATLSIYMRPHLTSSLRHGQYTLGWNKTSIIGFL